MKLLRKRVLGLVAALLMVLNVGTMGVYSAPGDYDIGDITAMNGIIGAHPSLGLSSAPPDGSEIPANWAGVVETSPSSGGRRITGLDLNNRTLGGNLNVSGLTSLERLACEETAIQGLDLNGLSSLQSVLCSKNDSLFYITGPTGHTLMISNVNTGGYAAISGYDVATNNVELTAFETGRSFAGWFMTPGGSLPRTNPLTVNLNDNINVLPLFILTEYYGRDVRAINAIIDNNGLKLTKADPDDGSYVPDDWKHVVRWRPAQHNQQVIFLDLTKQGLTGTLDVSGLENLTNLNCRDNQLTSLDVTGLTSLENLNVGQNRLTSLDLSGLTSLQKLYISNNPALVALTTPAERKATVIPAAGGTAYIYEYNCLANQAKLLALPDNNNSFVRWELSPGGNMATAFATVTMDSDVTGTPVFSIGSGGIASPSVGTRSGGSSGGDTLQPQSRILQRVDVRADGFTFTVDVPNLTKMALMRVLVDGEETSLYTVRNGSVIVTLKQELIDNLSPGKHRLRLEFLNHYGEADFNIGKIPTDTVADAEYSSNGNANPTTGR